MFTPEETFYKSIIDIDTQEFETNNLNSPVVKVETDSDRGLYIKVSDKNKCYRSAFNWTDWFYNLNALETHKDDIICDRTSVIEKLIECFNEQIKSLGISRVVLEKWWYGSQIMDEYLKGIFGSNEKYEFAKKMRAQFQKAVCRHPLEWDKTLFNCKKIEDSYFGITHTHLREHVKRKLVKESEHSDIWEGALQNIFKKNDFYFVNPLYFAYHLDRAEVFGFNPYEGKTYSEIFANCCNDDDIYDKDKKHIDKKYEEFYVKTNPGFAPVYDLKFPSKNTPNVNGYACVTGFFNSDYMNPHKNDKIAKSEYYHEGVDFRGGQGTDVVSLVYGEIICFGSSVSMGGIVLMRARFDTSLYYLAVHLDETSFSNLKENKKISPGDRIAKIGSYDSRGAHLHVSVIKLPEGVPPIGEGANKYKSATYKENGIWKFPTWGQESIYRSKMKNPFDYNSSDYWAGFTLKK